MVYRSQALQKIFGNESRLEQSNAADITRLRKQVETLTYKLQELTGERGDNPAVRANETWVKQAKNFLGSITQWNFPFSQ